MPRTSGAKKQFKTSALLCSSILALGISAQAADLVPCTEPFRNLLFSEIDLKSPALAKFLSGRAVARLTKTQPPSFKALESSLSSVEKNADATSLKIRNDQIKSDLTVENKDGVLKIAVDYVALVNDADGKGKSALKIGDKNPSLNLAFPRLLTAIASGISKQIERDPTIHHVVLEGNFIVNQRIAEQLKAFGFESNPTTTALLQSTKKGAAGLGSLANAVIMSALSNSETPVAGAKTTSMAVSTLLKVRSAYQNNLVGRDWRLVLELERPHSAETAAAIAE